MALKDTIKGNLGLVAAVIIAQIYNVVLNYFGMTRDFTTSILSDFLLAMCLSCLATNDLITRTTWEALKVSIGMMPLLIVMRVPDIDTFWENWPDLGLNFIRLCLMNITLALVHFPMPKRFSPQYNTTIYPPGPRYSVGHDQFFIVRTNKDVAKMCGFMAVIYASLEAPYKSKNSSVSVLVQQTFLKYLAMVFMTMGILFCKSKFGRTRLSVRTEIPPPPPLETTSNEE